MELWAHSVDLYDALGIDPVVKERITSTLFLSWQGRPNMYNVNGLAFDSEIPMYLELTLPSGELWTKGEPNDQNYIKGSAKDWRSWPSAAATGWTPASKWSATRRAPSGHRADLRRPRRSRAASEEPALGRSQNRPEGGRPPSGRYR